MDSLQPVDDLMLQTVWTVNSIASGPAKIDKQQSSCDLQISRGFNVLFHAEPRGVDGF